MAIIVYDGHGEINRDTAVAPPNVYVGNGQGCGTVWFDTVGQARRVIKQLGKIPDGKDSGLCSHCSCSYSYGTHEYKQYPEYACREYKESIAKVAERR